MMQVQATQSHPETSAADQKRAVRILAKSIFRELTSQGYDEKQIVALATELISAVAKKMSDAPPAKS